jgi:hypothetical protein
MNGRRHARGRHARPGGAAETVEPPDPTDAEAAAWLSDVTGGAADAGVVGSGALSSPFGMAGSRRMRPIPQTEIVAFVPGVPDDASAAAAGETGDTGPLRGPALETAGPETDLASPASTTPDPASAAADALASGVPRPMVEAAGPSTGAGAAGVGWPSALSSPGGAAEAASPYVGAMDTRVAPPPPGPEAPSLPSAPHLGSGAAPLDVAPTADGSFTRSRTASHRAVFSRTASRRPGLRRKGGGARAWVVPGVAMVRAAGTRWVVPFVASRRGQVVVGGVAGLGLALTVAIVVSGSGADPRAVAVNVPAGRVLPSTVSRSRAGRGVGDQSAMAYYQAKDPINARHVRNILWTGPMLRVYTDLPATDANSRTAIALCQTATAYLAGDGREPMVFVHADRNAGYPVLANKMSAGDDCRLNTVP